MSLILHLNTTFVTIIILNAVMFVVIIKFFLPVLLYFLLFLFFDFFDMRHFLNR